ncbi:hypothetical protein C2845_PM11G30370 [Panicum miliaceum]|uniref:Uncharacterized protein n=1 Tax=Panicum miliaceum TaxID=4540 RepID=A0A3L6RRU2_PANMI|nr:hypothetical protein C2845_PM11G30370 [Panicum miliaceum]
MFQAGAMATGEVALPPATPAGTFAEHPALSTANFGDQSSPSGLARGHINLLRWLLRCGSGEDEDELASSANARSVCVVAPQEPAGHSRFSPPVGWIG